MQEPISPPAAPPDVPSFAAIVALSAVIEDLTLLIVIALDVLPPAVIVKDASAEEVAAVNDPDGLLARLVAVVAVTA